MCAFFAVCHVYLAKIMKNTLNLEENMAHSAKEDGKSRPKGAAFHISL